MNANWKEKYDELIKRAKADDKFFDSEEGKYYRKLWADEFPEFFNDSEVLRSKQEQPK